MRILVVHPHRLIAESLVTALQTTANIEIADCVSDMSSALTLLETRGCDLVLASITLPENAALCLAARLADGASPVKVLVTDLAVSKAQVLACLEEGAAGYVYAHESLANLTLKMQAVHNHEFPIAPDIAAGLIARIEQLKRRLDVMIDKKLVKRQVRSEQLTAREQEVLQLLARGHTNHEIARMFVIEVGTVKNHVHNIFRKLDITSREQCSFFVQPVA